MHDTGDTRFFSVELYLDPESEEAIVRLRDAIDARLGRTLPQGRPHLTLGACRELDMEVHTAQFQAVGGSAAGDSIEFSSLGLFLGGRSVLFLAPVVTGPLLALHRNVHDRLRQISFETADLYHPGRWVPHCTLVAELTHPELASAIDIVSTLPLRMAARICSIDIREFRTASLPSMTE